MARLAFQLVRYEPELRNRTVARRSAGGAPSDFGNRYETAAHSAPGGTKASYGSATNDNRGMKLRGWCWVVENNDYEVFSNVCSDGKYRINDGEGLIHEDHCNSTIVDSRLVGNHGNTYLSLFHVGVIDGLHVEGNYITSGHIPPIYVTAARHKQPGDFPIRRVTIVKNTTRGHGIRVQGSPSEKVVVKDNRHLGETPAALFNDCPSAELANNTNYEVKQTRVKN